jgi:hypothetical protein
MIFGLAGVFYQWGKRGIFRPGHRKPGNDPGADHHLFEVFKRVLVERNRDDALAAIALMKEGREGELDDSPAPLAAELPYELKLPLANSIFLSTARECNAMLWTQDVHFKDLEAVKYIEKRY